MRRRHTILAVALGTAGLAVAQPATGATTTSPPTTAAPTTTAPTGKTLPDGSTSTTTVAPMPSVPPTDPSLASRIPTVDGYTIAPTPADLLWQLFDASLPGELTRHHALVVAADGVPVARLVVAAGTGERSAIDTFVEHTFADEVQLPVDALRMDDGSTFTVSNSASPIWTAMEDNAVIVAEQEIDGNFQWAWSADDAVWVVRGKRDAEDYVRALLRLHAASVDPYDQQGMTGDLFDYTPSVPGFMYWDAPRTATLGNLSGNWLGECAERFYLGYVRPDAAADTPHSPDDLDLAISEAAGWCVEDGFLDDLAADIASRPGAHPEQIGGLNTSVDQQTIVALVGDVIVVLGSGNSQTFAEMLPFIEGFFTGLPR
jgi:hypothetical protein